MKPLDFGTLELQEANAPSVPSAVTLLVSLFLILLTFFICINQNTVKNNLKKETAIKSMAAQFGKPEDDQIGFGGIIKPKVNEYALEIEKLFGENARIESTVDGNETIITASKNFFYFEDELNFRQEKLDMLLKLQDILRRWDRSANLQMTFILGLSTNYEMDKQRLQNFRRAMARNNIDVGLDPTNTDKFTIVIKYD